MGTGTLKADSPNAQVAQVTLTGVTAGKHTLTAVFTNANGATESKPVKVTVK